LHIFSICVGYNITLPYSLYTEGQSPRRRAAPVVVDLHAALVDERGRIGVPVVQVRAVGQHGRLPRAPQAVGAAASAFAAPDCPTGVTPDV